MLRTITATRYVTPLREGGSLPAIVEADDAGLYVLKFRGAGQGVKALIAEIIAGELARSLGLRVPELVLVELDAALSRAEPDEEIRELLKASTGLNLGMDYLPGSMNFDPLVGPAPAALEASLVVGFDAYVTNVDRTAKNPNLLRWHKALWLIDHGAALYFHHDWEGGAERSQSRFGAIRSHVLLPWATALAEAQSCLREQLTPEAIAHAVASIPEAWLGTEPRFASAAEHRAAYTEYLLRRREALPGFMEEAANARAQLI